MSSIFKHELSLHFHSLTAYVFGAALLLFVGLGVTVVNLEYEWATFEYALAQSLLFLAFVFPILTMRTFAEERHQKTDQLLYSLPVSTTEVVLGKFLALLVIFLIPTLIIGTYPLILKQYGNVFMPASYGSLAAFFIMGAAFIAIGMFIYFIYKKTYQGVMFNRQFGVSLVALTMIAIAAAAYYLSKGFILLLVQ